MRDEGSKDEVESDANYWLHLRREIDISISQLYKGGCSDWVRTCTHEYKISELLKQQCKVLNSTAIASGYAGRDPQGGTSDGIFLVSFLLRYKGWLKLWYARLAIFEKEVEV